MFWKNSNKKLIETRDNKPAKPKFEDTDIGKAFLEREKVELESFPADVAAMIRSASSERSHNQSKIDYPSIGVILEAEVSKTLDTNENVITLKTLDGRVFSLWMAGNKVRSITRY